jgi:hypothetical protein
VPVISRFLGIVIAMFYNDHDPPHFHAKYGEYEIRVAIETGEIMSGSFPRRAQSGQRQLKLRVATIRFFGFGPRFGVG